MAATKEQKLEQLRRMMAEIGPTGAADSGKRRASGKSTHRSSKFSGVRKSSAGGDAADYIHTLDAEESNPCQDHTDPSLADPQKAFNRIEALFSHRDRSEAELRTKLKAEGFVEKAVEEALEKAKDYKLVDDARFADSFIRGRLRSGKGNYAIERDLKAKGIDLSSLPDWPQAYEQASYDSQYERASQFLAAHPPRSKNPQRSAYEKLVRKGYPSVIAAKASKQWFHANFG